MGNRFLLILSLFLQSYRAPSLPENRRIGGKINLKVTRLLRTIEKIPENLSWIIPSYVTHADSIYAITRQVVLNNYEIFGCAIAFEPYYFPDKGYYFAPYSYMSGDSVVTTQIDPKYDYYQKIGTGSQKKGMSPAGVVLTTSFRPTIS